MFSAGFLALIKLLFGSIAGAISKVVIDRLNLRRMTQGAVATDRLKNQAQEISDVQKANDAGGDPAVLNADVMRDPNNRLSRAPDS